MRAIAALLATMSLGLASPADACRRPSFAITPSIQEAFGDFQLFRIRTISALIRSDLEAGASHDLLALEAIVLGGPDEDRAPTRIRIILPDRWSVCGELYSPAAINDVGQIEGYVLLQRDPQTEYFLTRESDVVRNRERLLRHHDALEWRTVRFR